MLRCCGLLRGRTEKPKERLSSRLLGLAAKRGKGDLVGFELSGPHRARLRFGSGPKRAGPYEDSGCVGRAHSGMAGTAAATGAGGVRTRHPRAEASGGAVEPRGANTPPGDYAAADMIGGAYVPIGKFTIRSPAR